MTSPARILVVDDEPGVVRAVQRVLEPLHAVRACTDPREAPDEARRFDPDIAICDVRMPGLDGFELVDRLREVCPDVDVILMTGSMTEQDAHLVRALQHRAFYFVTKPFEREVLLALVDRCLEVRRLRRAERRHLERIEQELGAARAFQRAMLPAEHAEFGAVTVDAVCRPCTELAGDLVDFARAGDDAVMFIVADVCGHGVPAALLTGTVKTAFRAGAGAGRTPGETLEGLVEALASFRADRFVTAFCGRLDRAAGILDYVNAGHPAGLLFTGTAPPQPLDATAPLLSTAFPPGSWSDARRDLPGSGRLFIHTDGLADPASPDDGAALRRARELLADPARSGKAALDALLEDIEVRAGGRAPLDDVTVLVVSW